MKQHHAVGGENRPAFFEERRVLGLAEMLEGADRHDAVRLLVKRLPTLQAEVDAVLSGGQPLAMVKLVFTERQSDNVNSMMGMRPERRSSPSATDIQQTMATLQFALAQRQFHLGNLRVGKRCVRPVKFRAGIG